MIMSVNISQNSFPVPQANSMNRRFGSSFEIPAGSFGMFTIISIIIWIALYDRVLILPIASKIMGKHVHLSARKRMAIGMLLSFVCMVVTATVEAKRRNLAIREGYSDDSEAMVDMSALWLLPQLCLIGFAEALSAVAQNEFYSEFPLSMKSIASTLFFLETSVANLVASFLMNIIDELSKRGGKESWISTNINKGHYDYYYWVLAGLSMLNMIYFLICTKAYGPGKEDKKEITLPGQDEQD